MSDAFIEYGGKRFPLRINPKEVNFTYSLNTFTDETYGGKIIQILSVNIDSLSVSGQCGTGGRNELLSIAHMFKEMITWQNNSNQPGRFAFPAIGYSFKVYGLKMSISRNMADVTFPYTLTFNVEEDETGTASADTMKTEFDRLQDGIGYVENEYNTPVVGQGVMSSDGGAPSPSTATYNSKDIVKPKEGKAYF